jgi:hydroxymethylbilane synthase
MQSIRGNVPTRLEKLDSQNYDAIVLAAAGLKRLGIEDRITRYFEPHEMTPAPGQGILALQIQESNTGLQALLARINDPDVAQVAHIERFFSRAVGGGCKSPVGAYAFRDGDICRFIGMRQDASLRIIRKEVSAPWSNSTTLGEELAKEVLSI